MGATTALMIGTTLKAGSQIVGGHQKAKALEYNASLYDQQVVALEQAKQVDVGRLNRQKAYVTGSQVAAVASSGIEMTGSPMEVMNQTLTNFEYDEAIMRYNYDLEKFNAHAQGQQLRAEGASARRSGLLQGMGTFVQGSIGASKHSASPVVEETPFGAGRMTLDESYYDMFYPTSKTWGNT